MRVSGILPPMSSQAFAVFDTAIGACAFVWSEAAIVGAFLPEADEGALRPGLSSPCTACCSAGHGRGCGAAGPAVGDAMRRNPVPILLPCHRVLGAGGKPGGFWAPGGVETKLRMLAIEVATVGETPALCGDLPLAVRPR